MSQDLLLHEAEFLVSFLILLRVEIEQLAVQFAEDVLLDGGTTHFEHFLALLVAQVVLALESLDRLVHKADHRLHWLRQQKRRLLDRSVLKVEVFEVLLDVPAETVLLLGHDFVQLVDRTCLCVQA